LVLECQNAGLSLKPTTVICDFEESIHIALREVWNNVSIFGCRFHLTQSWYRKIQNLGLCNVHTNNKTPEGQWLNNIFGLIFLNLNEVGSCFVEDFISIIPADIKFQIFADYLTENYIDNNSLFPTHI